MGNSVLLFLLLAITICSTNEMKVVKLHQRTQQNIPTKIKYLQRFGATTTSPSLIDTKAVQKTILTPRTRDACSSLQCPPVERPVCARLVDRAGNRSVYVVMVNKCEMSYIKCHKGLEGVVVPMKNCDHNLSKTKGKKRSKRDAMDMPQQQKLNAAEFVKTLGEPLSDDDGVNEVNGIDGYAGQSKGAGQGDQGDYGGVQEQYVDQGQNTGDQDEYDGGQGQNTEDQGEYVDQGQNTGDQVENDGGQGQNTEDQGEYVDQGQNTEDQDEYDGGQGQNTEDQGEYIDQGQNTGDQVENDGGQGQNTGDQEVYLDQGQNTGDQVEYGSGQGQNTGDNGDYVDQGQNSGDKEEIGGGQEQYVDHGQNSGDEGQYVNQGQITGDQGQYVDQDQITGVQGNYQEDDVAYQSDLDLHWTKDYNYKQILEAHLPMDTFTDAIYDEDVDRQQYNGDCPVVCPLRDVMVCARCQHGVYRTFLSVCHLRMFNCLHKEETLTLMAREPCMMSAPFLSDEASEPQGRLHEPQDDDRVLRYLRCNQLSQGSREADPRCYWLVEQFKKDDANNQMLKLQDDY